MEKRIANSSTDDKIVDLEEYKKSPLHQQRLEENITKPKIRTEKAKKKSKKLRRRMRIYSRLFKISGVLMKNPNLISSIHQPLE